MKVQGVKRNEKLTQITPPTITSEKKTVHNVFIIDASGSMSGYKYHNAISGVNKIITDISKDIDISNTISIVEFEGNRIVRRRDFENNFEAYHEMGTGGNTPLNRAIGETLEHVRDTRAKDYSTDDKVLVSIFTDGGENSSHGSIYHNPAILEGFINELKDQGFTITFIGTQAEVRYAVQVLNMDVSNTLVHANTADSIKDSYGTTLRARSAFAKSVARGEDVKMNFYTKTVAEEKK